LHGVRYNGVIYGVELDCRSVCGLDDAERCILKSVERGRVD